MGKRSRVKWQKLMLPNGRLVKFKFAVPTLQDAKKQMMRECLTAEMRKELERIWGEYKQLGPMRGNKP